MAEIASAYISLVPSFRGGASTINNQLSGPVGKAGGLAGAGYGKAFLKGFIALGIATKVGQFIGDAFGEAREAQVVGAKVAAVIAATGGAANITAAQVDKLATSISKKTGIDDEQIATSQALLLTFKNVANEAGRGNDIFNRASAALVDLSVAGFGSTDSAAKQLGKALNDPLKGLTALSRAGVTFTAGQQEQIKSLVASGETLRAQKIILAEVESQVGGVAAASATAGEKASVAFGNIKEQIGTALLPAVDFMANLFTTKAAPAISGFITGLQGGSGAAGGFGNFLRTNVLPVLTDLGQFITTQVVPAFQGGLRSALESGRAGFNAIRQAIAENRPEVDQIVALVKRLYVVLYTQVMPAAIKFAGILAGQFAQSISIGITVVSQIVREVNRFRTVLDVVVNGIQSFATAGVSGFRALKDGATKVLGNLLDFVQTVPGKIKGFFASLPGQMVAIGGQIIDGLVNGIKGAAGRVAAAVASITAGIPGKIKSLMGIASPSKVTTELGGFIAEGLARGMAGGAEGVGKAAESLANKAKEHLDRLKDRVSSLKGEFASLKDSISGAFTQNLFEPTDTAGFISNLMGTSSQLQQVKSAFETLKGYGLSGAFLSQLFASGNGGLAISLAGAGQQQALEASSLYASTTSLSDAFGAQVAKNDPLGKRLDKANEKADKLNDKVDGLREDVRRVGKDVAGALNGVAGAAVQSTPTRGGRGRGGRR